MFTNSISNTAFCTPRANKYFEDKIISMTSGYGDDCTFISSLRAFLYNKMSDGDKLVFRYRNVSMTDAVGKLVSLAPEVNQFAVYDIRTNSLSYTDKEVLKSAANDNGWEYVEKISNLFAKEFDVICFRNAERRNVIMFVPGITLKKWHLLQCCVLGVLPWYFDPSKGELEDDDKDLMYSFRKSTDDEYLKVLNRIASKIDFKSGYIRSALNGFETRGEKKSYDDMQREIRNYEQHIAELRRAISDALQAIDYRNTMLMGLAEKINRNQGDSEIMEYFLSNSNLDLVTVNGGTIRYICKGYLTYWDTSEVESYIKNKNSRFYLSDPWDGRKYRNMPSFEDAEKLLRAIFIDRKLKVRICAAYSLSIDDNYVSGLQNYGYGGEYDCYMANPHIDFHSCIGTFDQIFMEKLTNHDYVGCIEQTMVSALSITVDDFTVISEFMKLLWSDKSTDRSTTNTTKCIELPNGVCLDARDAIQWLKEEEEMNEQNN